jgi:hypothetical protein
LSFYLYFSGFWEIVGQEKQGSGNHAALSDHATPLKPTGLSGWLAWLSLCKNIVACVESFLGFYSRTRHLICGFFY